MTIYTQAYNTKPYLQKCISSVLEQTYPNFEYLLVDNGCTDGSSEMLEQFARQDSRIRLIQFKENQFGPRPKISAQYGTGTYYTVLDSDDWWEPDFLEGLVQFLEKYNLDLAITGAVSCFEATGKEQVLRKLDTPIVLTQEQFAQEYPKIWTFPSANWASIIRMELYRSVDPTQIYNKRLAYGGDTVLMLELIKQCYRIGIDNRASYHYRIRQEGVSYHYQTRRLEANVFYYQHIERFLASRHTLDESKKFWLKGVHTASLIETTRLLSRSGLQPQEIAKECARIAAHPLTEHIFEQPVPEEAGTLRAALLTVLLQAAGQCAELEPDYVVEAARHIAPAVCGAVWAGNAGLYLKEPGLCKALLEDNSNGLMSELLVLISQKKYSKQYDLGKIAQGLNPKGSLLHEVADTRFIREHLEIYQMLYREERLQALDAMTGLLLEGKRLYGREQFLKLYLSVAALEEQIPAFLFGKEQLALLLYEEARLEECREILSELAEMGVEDSEVIVAIKQALEGAT